MAKYPVEISDSEGIVEAVNTLLSGPSGLGQNFAGFSSFEPSYLTGNPRLPFTIPTETFLYIAPINLGVSEMLDERTRRFYFSSTQPTPPFSNGNPITISGVTDSFYNGTYAPIGVVECTTTYVIVRTTSSYNIESPSSGGTASYQNTQTTFNQDSGWVSTDCNARVTVTGATDRVFVSTQLNGIFSYDATTSGDLEIYIAINRYRASVNSDPTINDYIFNYDSTIAQKHVTYSGLSGVGSLPEIDTTFTTVLDQPSNSQNSTSSWIAYYWYILELQFVSTDVKVTKNTFYFRSLSAQVVKQ